MSWTLADSVHVTVVWNHKQAVFRFVTLLWHTISKNLAQKLSRARKSQSNHQYEYCLETQELVCGLRSNWVFLIIFPPLYYTLWNYVSVYSYHWLSGGSAWPTSGQWTPPAAGDFSNSVSIPSYKPNYATVCDIPSFLKLSCPGIRRSYLTPVW